MPLDPDHYCIQAERIQKMDSKLDDIHGQFQVDGTIGVMSGQIKRLTALAENGSKKDDVHKEKMTLWIIVLLAAVIAGLVGINLPF